MSQNVSFVETGSTQRFPGFEGQPSEKGDCKRQTYIDGRNAKNIRCATKKVRSRVAMRHVSLAEPHPRPLLSRSLKVFAEPPTSTEALMAQELMTTYLVRSHRSRCAIAGFYSHPGHC